MSQILVIDDEPAICWSLKEGLSDEGHKVQVASSMERAEKILTTFAPDVIVLDVRLPGKSGLSALPELRAQQPGAPIIMMTAFGDLQTVVQALNQGAFEYLVKPFEMDEFLSVISRALLAKNEPSSAAETIVAGDQLIGRGPAMQAVFKRIALVAPTDFPVLITGETGTGKELVAEAIHRNSLRRDGRFLRVSLASFSPSVIESELFGHVKGAFTGAVEDRPGLFEMADNGTIFLDEVGDTPPAIQVKLLRVLESRRFTRVGSNDERTTNARLLAATNRDVNSMIHEGTFREDLYHRLKVFSFELPPLREHREDLQPLVEYFIARHTQSSPPLITGDFWSAIRQRAWHGNVRELRNAIDHALILARGGPLTAQHLPEPLIVPLANLPPGAQLETAVAAWIRQQLAETNDDSESDLYRRFLTTAESVLFNEVLSYTQQNRRRRSETSGTRSRDSANQDGNNTVSRTKGKPQAEDTARRFQRIQVIDSHTGGEPTRVVFEGGPDLGHGSMADRRTLFAQEADKFRSTVVNEPRGSDVIVGALLCEPLDSECVAGVLFFNNVGPLWMCGHGTIGVGVTLGHLGRITAGTYQLETAVGRVKIEYDGANRVSLENVPSYRFTKDAGVDVAGLGKVVGDIAWGGNWFFLADAAQFNRDGGPFDVHDVERLTDIAWRIRQSLEQQGITGANGGMIDHIELFGPPADPKNGGRNFVLCPGRAYDRSPCGTGTSAKMACLYADGHLNPGEVWRQESILGSLFEGSIRVDGDQIIPRISGTAYITAETTLVLDNNDPFRTGIRR